MRLQTHNMALFGSKKQEGKDSKAATSASDAAKRALMPAVEDVLMRPRITEKAAIGTGDNVYVFNVRPGTKKPEIAAAVRRVYGVTVTKVNVVTIPTKPVSRRGIRGVKRGGKKAYVYLKKGDKIELM